MQRDAINWNIDGFGEKTICSGRYVHLSAQSVAIQIEKGQDQKQQNKKHNAKESKNRPEIRSAIKWFMEINLS